MQNNSDDQPLRVQLLGDFRLSYGDELVTKVDTPRLQSLLAYLLLHRGATQLRHHLAFLFWPDSPEDQALTNLRNLLYRLRHSLPDADRFLDIDRKMIRWRVDSPFELDVARFEAALATARGATGQERRSALKEAVAVYRGDLLPSCYEDWIEAHRERLRQAFGRALQTLVRLYEGRREYRKAIRYAQRLLRHDALRESSYRQLMRLRALSGDRAGALQVYQDCARILERELDVEPGPATRELYQRLLAAQTAPTASTRKRSGISNGWPLVGRRETWARLRQAWRIASGGRPRVALITGEAGIGKTRLAEELVQWARRQGVLTATARCHPSEGELAYAPIAAWLRALPLPPLDPVWQTEVARILPELLAQRPDLTEPGPLVEPWQQRRFFEALARTMLASGEPLLLFIDSLQWCDRGTLEWLHYLLRYEPRARLLVLAALRPHETEDRDVLRSLLHDLRRDDQLSEISLGPLDKDEVGTLAVNVADRELHPTLIDCLYHETEGNPLFIVETVRAGLPDEVRGSPAEGFVCLPRPLPSRMRDALLTRLEQLSPLARGLAELAATIGREFSFDVLLQASDVGEEMLVQGLDELWQQDIVRERGSDAYDFSHDKLREVAYEQLSEARQRLLHRYVAQALETVHAEELDLVAARVANHYERADEYREAVSYYDRAANFAERTSIQQDARRYRRRAARLRGEMPGETD